MAEKKGKGAVDENVLTIVVPTVFNSKNNPNVKIVSIIDGQSKNGSRSFGVLADKVTPVAGRSGQMQLYSVKLPVDWQYGTSILVTTADNKDKFLQEQMTGQQLFDLWSAGMSHSDKKASNPVMSAVTKADAVQDKKPVGNAQPVKDDSEKKTARAIGVSGDSHVYLRNIPASRMLHLDEPAKPQGQVDLIVIKVDDSASKIGYGNLRVPRSAVKPVQASGISAANKYDVDLGSASGRAYYDVQSSQGRWVHATGTGKNDMFTVSDMMQIFDRFSQGHELYQRHFFLNNVPGSRLTPVDDYNVAVMLPDASSKSGEGKLVIPRTHAWIPSGHAGRDAQPTSQFAIQKDGSYNVEIGLIALPNELLRYSVQNDAGEWVDKPFTPRDAVNDWNKFVREGTAIKRAPELKARESEIIAQAESMQAKEPEKDSAQVFDDDDCVY